MSEQPLLGFIENPFGNRCTVIEGKALDVYALS
jgi:hypothetical protein